MRAEKGSAAVDRTHGGMGRSRVLHALEGGIQHCKLCDSKMWDDDEMLGTIHVPPPPPAPSRPLPLVCICLFFN